MVLPLVNFSPVMDSVIDGFLAMPSAGIDSYLHTYCVTGGTVDKE